MTDVFLIFIMQASSSSSSSDDFPFQHEGFLVVLRLLVEDPADDGIAAVDGLIESAIPNGRLPGSQCLVCELRFITVGPDLFLN